MSAAGSRNVKGLLFADYVRMVRSHKGVDWSHELAPEDLPFLVEKIDPVRWYPMATFERLGNAILAKIALGELQAVRMWGRFSVDQMRAMHDALLAPGDCVETLNRFCVMRSTFFDFEALEIIELAEDEAHVVIRYHMGNPAEEAASFQTMGFFERLLEMAGAGDLSARFVERSWAGDPRTLLQLHWKITPKKL